MAQNQLKYTGLTYDEIQAQISALLYTDSRFDRFRESSIAQTLIEVFTGTTDILNYYLNRRAEETFFDTAQLKSSVISLSRMLGYVMNRSEPAQAYLKLTIKGDIGDNQIQIPSMSKFSYGGNNYILLNTLTYRLTPDQVTVMNAMKDNFTLSITEGTSQFKDSSNNGIKIVQGDIREKVINGSNNPQVGAPFQIYKIDDPTFSNVYGDKDYFHNKITKVWVGENKSDSNQFIIDRRSLLSWEAINASTTLDKAQSICLIRTSTDGSVEVLFGDADPTATNTIKNPQATAGFARKGAITPKDNIYVQYLSTKGSAANTNSVVGNKVDFSGKIYNSSNVDITNKISFTFDSNIFGGADDESADSIKYSAPKIYYSLDRLVSKQDYVAYLKSITSPIDVQNALAWGEQEERNRSGTFALVKMFNVVLFTVLGSLYGVDAGKRYAKSISQYSDAVLDLYYSPYNFQTQGYFNVYMVQNMVNQLKQYTLMSAYYNISGNNFGNTLIGSNSIAPTNTSIAEDIKLKIKTQYPNGLCTLTFDYTSDIDSNASNIKAVGSVNVNLGEKTLTDQVGETYLSSVADIINTALSQFKDVRGNQNDNVNYNKPAFIGKYDNNVLIQWVNETTSTGNSSTYLFNLKFKDIGDSDVDSTSPCYITSFLDDFILDILGLNLKTSYLINQTNYKSENNGKITKIIDDLSKRSQISIQNIYVSPIIHRFNLIGTVYVKSMYDRHKVRSEIMDAVYAWADQYADFNVPIYMSNIMEIIESNQGVINANVKLQPEDITNGVNNGSNKYYNPDPSQNNVYKKYYDESETAGTILANTINSALAQYLNQKPLNINENRSEYSNYADGLDTISYQNILECYSYTLNTYITERTFYDNFAGPLYKSLLSCAKVQAANGTKITTPINYTSEYDCKGNSNISPNYSLFIQYNYENVGETAIQNATLSSDFAIIMQQIYRDLSYIIMVNMLDSSGNIDTEYDYMGKRIRGGYSLGSEIAQLILDGVNNENIPLLNFEYKD